MSVSAVAQTAHETEYGLNWCFRFEYRANEERAVQHFENMKRTKLDNYGWQVTGFRDFQHADGTVTVFVRDYFARRERSAAK